MGQVTIYLDAELEARIASAVADRKISRSRWIAEVIRKHLAQDWPAEVRESAGAWGDFPTLEELRNDLNPMDSREDF